MNKLSRVLITLTAFAMLASAAIAGELEPGDVAPAFTLMDQNGKEVSLADYEGKLVVLEWTNPECPYVVRHYKAKTMTTLDEKWSKEGVQWLTINSSHHHGVEHALAFAKAEGIHHPVLSDTSGEVGRAYGAKTTPHMFVISPEGKVLYAGAIDDDKAGKAEHPHNYVDAALTAATSGHEIEMAQTKPYGCSVKYGEAKAAKAASTSR